MRFAHQYSGANHSGANHSGANHSGADHSGADYAKSNAKADAKADLNSKSNACANAKADINSKSNACANAKADIDAAPLPGSREPLRQCRVLRLRLLVFLRRRLLRQLVFLLRCARLRHIERVLLWRQ